MQCPVSINYWRQYVNSYIPYTMVRASLLTWTHTLSNLRQHTLPVVLLHRLSSSALRKEVSGYKCCDVIASRLICMRSRVYLYRNRKRYFHLVLISCVASSTLQKWRCHDRHRSQCLKPWIRV